MLFFRIGRTSGIVDGQFESTHLRNWGTSVSVILFFLSNSIGDEQSTPSPGLDNRVYPDLEVRRK